MRLADWHTYQVLTKRSERMRDLLSAKLREAADAAAHLVGRQRREPPTRPAPDRASASRPCEGAVPVHRALLEDLGPLDLEASPGSSSAARAATGPGRWSRTGSAPSGTSARPPAFRSSSSNGAASARTATGVNAGRRDLRRRCRRPDRAIPDARLERAGGYDRSRSSH